MSTATGQQAEQAALEYLDQQGYKIIGQNWRTRWCEIDIVAEKDKRVHFVEVKYRASSSQGSGLDYITPRKLRQMRFAAEMWVQNHNWRGDYGLSALEVSGPTFQVTDFLPDCS
jgi:uncharacterized protein (TIGR00252 family)